MADLLDLNEQENKKQIITMDFQNLKEMVNNMAKSILAFTQAKIDIIIKTLVKWFVYLANEPSLGLFFIQLHFRDSLKEIVENKKNLDKTIKKLENTKMSITNITKELDEIGDLNTRWASSMSTMFDNLNF